MRDRHRTAHICLAIVCADAVARGPLGLVDDLPDVGAGLYLVVIVVTLIVLGSTLLFRVWLVAILTPTFVALVSTGVDSPVALFTEDTAEGAGSVLVHTGLVFSVLIALGAGFRLLAAVVSPGAARRDGDSYVPS